MADDSTSGSSPAEQLAYRTRALARIAQQSGGHLEREEDDVRYYLDAIDESLRELEDASAISPASAPSADGVVLPNPGWVLETCNWLARWSESITSEKVPLARRCWVGLDRYFQQLVGDPT